VRTTGQQAVALALLVTLSLVAGVGGAAAASGDLRISASNISNNTTTVGDSVTFTVKNDSGTVNASVEYNGQTKYTGTSDTVSFTFDSTGTQTVTANYNDSTASIEIDVQKKQYDIAHGAQSSSVKAGNSVTFKPSASDQSGSNPYNGNYTLSFNTSKTDTTISSGDSVQFDTPGTVEVRVSVPDTETRNYVSATTTIDVTKKSLKFSSTAKNGTNGYDVKVTDANGAAIDATLTYGANQTMTTGADGEATITFDQEGTYEIEASAGDQYGTATTTATVDFDDLTFSSAPSSVAPDEDATFKVSAGNGGLSGVTVSFGGDSGVTNESGEVTLTAPTEGDSANVTAEKDDYSTAEKTVTLNRKSLSFSNTNYNGTNAVDLTINSGNVNATLTYGDNQTVTTGDDGEATLTFEQEGDYTVEASAGVKYETATKTVSIDFDDLTFSSAPSSVAPSEETTFTVTDGNGVVSGVTVTFGENSGITNESGEVTLAAPTTGDSAAVTAEKQYYTTTNDTISLDENSLSISSAPQTGTNTVDVTTKLGGSQGNATLTYAGGQTTTGDDGQATIAFEAEGNYTIDAAAGVAYETATANVTVEFNDLSVTANQSSIVPEGDVKFTVEDGSGAVGGVDVTFDGQTKQTADDGTVTFTAPATEQTVAVDVTKDYYNGTSTEITVDRAGTDYNFTANRTDIVIGETVQFTANNSDGPQTVTLSDNESWEANTESDGTVTRTFERPGTYEITASGDSYENRTLTVEVSGRTSTLTLGNDELNTNKTTVRNLTLDQAYNGLSGYRVMLTLPDNGSATFNESETSYVPDLGLNTTISVTDNGTALELEATDVNENIQAESTNVTLAQVGIDGESAGPANVSITVESMESDPDQETDRKPYQLTTETTGGQFAVLNIPTIGDSTVRPSDTDDDGVYEDVNGNGEIDYNDVVSLYNNLDSESVQGNVDAFDLDGNGAASYNDIVQLNDLAQPESA
jgi:plastocyanin